MSIHPSKSQFLTVSVQDNAPFFVDEAAIKYTTKYVYLGTPVMNESVATQICKHVDMKMPHCFKYSSFISKNFDSPFTVKLKV